ncbi:TatB protein (twin arginine translocation) [Legionella geestiana]|uniref:TatB protein (Twin arginine translocation) n=2 Tax=Legionella geestiana TaxID=45065 RepID=A0A0W0TPR4_9GAMM|nr:twin-arginine translocase TatA/TatE family subunit [Legionella geestiana]KTC97253.1 TatB protein (twin arginine translocation) [Legionella geestiana]QBS12385.1 twin-arginine translocase TatA/TatE family subunit [Legionella geestiana]QDQ39902.1 twin-arginine translocase TatA/TatE family subunit [Legionella geestiana]STX55176.1 sec-independent protein translocase protein TatB [Legionella geestiana]
MSMAEVGLTLIIAVCVFGPSRLPMLARHLGAGLRRLKMLRERFSGMLEEVAKECTLAENEKRAADADARYEDTR